LQSTFAKENIASLKSGSGKNDSIIYMRNGVHLYSSDAAFFILKDLGSPWNFFFILYYIPRIVRDFFYKIIAHYRYRIFGVRKECFVPGENQKERFL
jgi:predicted DCC family thiol-disulfide oxidoreductase YuxK